LTRHSFVIALFLCIAFVGAAVAQSSVGALGGTLAAGLTRSPVAYIPIISRNNDGLPIPTATPAPHSPDLIITGLVHTDTYAFPNVPLHLSMTIRNQGEGPANGFDVGWTPGDADHPDWIVEAAGLNLAAGQEMTIEWQYTWGWIGEYATVGAVDYGNKVIESNESNNTQNLSLNVSTF
jgi:subtilase family serine protease